MATDLVPVAWGAGEGLPGWVVLGKAGLVEGEDFCLMCVFLGHVSFPRSGEGDLASLAGLKPVPGQAGPLLPRPECSGELAWLQGVCGEMALPGRRFLSQLCS